MRPMECLLFDLDNTLYSKSAGIYEAVVERIWQYMEVRMGYEKEYARALRRDYVADHGSTLRGLMIHQNVDPEDYLSYVHDVGVEKRLGPNPDLGRLLEAVSCNRVIFTSSHLPHARKVLQCLGVEPFFSNIFDITFTGYIPKPNLEPYHKVLETLGLDGRACMMIEDTPVNLQPAKALGMTTVLVGEEPGGEDGFVDYRIDDILEMETVLKERGLL
jgi:putative hydrolase of the HAD superfamily